MPVVLILLVVAAPSVALEAPADEGSWIQHRAHALLTEDLTALGYHVRRPSSLGSSSPDGLRLRLQLRPPRVERGGRSVTLTLQTVGGRADRVMGPAADIEGLVAGLAMTWAQAQGGRTVSAGQLNRTPLPFVVHRALGRASVRLAAGRLRQAMLAFDQAGRSARAGPLPAAIDGRRRAYLGLVQSGGTRFGQRTDLADASLERARVAAQHKDREAERRAWESFLRYTEAYARRWAVPASLPVTARLYASRGSFRLAAPRARWRLDARTGHLDDRRPSPKGLVGVLGEEALTLQDRRLARFTRDNEVRWQTKLPLEPQKYGVLTTSGYVGVLGGGAVAWVDAGLGQLGQVARGVRPLAWSTGGVLVRQSDPKADVTRLALLRPGKMTPVWKVDLPPIRSARMSRERVAVVTRQGLHLLRTHNGKPARPVRRWPEGFEWLHVEGRYGTGVNGRTVVLFDVLAGEQTGRLTGPGTPMAALTQSSGAAILFDTADLLFVDRDARLVDRARPPGRPLQLIEGHPEAPGPIVVTTEGVFAFAEIQPSRARDVDALLGLARIIAADAPRQALRLASSVARRSAGRVDQAERLRSELLRALGDAPAAKRAAARAVAGRDPTRPLPPFRL